MYIAFMASNTVTISGMFGDGKTYFADSPVVIDISGLDWGSPVTSPFTIVRVEVIYEGRVVGNFHSDTGGQTTASFDISTALKAIWRNYDYAGTNGEIAKANAALTTNSGQTASRSMREYSLKVYTEYMASDNGGVYTTTEYGPFTGGQCLMGGYTQWERSLITNDADRDVSYLEHKGPRNGDASTKPTASPERVGSNSITSWLDVKQGYTKSIFYPAAYNNGAGESDDPQQTNPWTGHAPIVLRDNQPYVDFLFINRRGAIETCSGMTKEAMSINSTMTQYSRTDGPTFRPTRSLMAIGTDGRRSWQMSSGYVTREWAEWWTQEFVNGKRKQWWMLWQGPGAPSAKYVPVTIKAAKSDTTIYDRTKQQLAHVDFTVTLALEG